MMLLPYQDVFSCGHIIRPGTWLESSVILVIVHNLNFIGKF